MKPACIKLILPGVLISVILSGSCTHYYHVPNIQNVPLLKEKNEIHFSGSYGGGDESNCIEIQGAYAATEKLGLMANFMSARGGGKSEKDYANGYYFEGAAGYYKAFNQYAIFEVFGGLGARANASK